MLGLDLLNEQIDAHNVSSVTYMGSGGIGIVNMIAGFISHDSNS